MTRRVTVALALVLLGLTACGDGGRSSPDATGPESDLVVFAAASLTDAFTQLGDDFAAAHPEVTVTFNFGASSTLAQQIVSGAPADVFAAASAATMAVVTDADGVDGEPVVLARNRLEIAVPVGNPGDVDGLGDFADPDLEIALCAEAVPCGAAAAKAFAAAEITPAPDTLEQDVRAALTKVELGEVDAALVYRTDVIAAGGAVEGIEFPEASEAINDYPVAVLAGAPDAVAAQAFVDFLLSAPALQVLADAGFDTD